MKKLFIFLLISIAVLSLGISLGSCKAVKASLEEETTLTFYDKDRAPIGAGIIKEPERDKALGLVKLRFNPDFQDVTITRDGKIVNASLPDLYFEGRDCGPGIYIKVPDMYPQEFFYRLPSGSPRGVVFTCNFCEYPLYYLPPGERTTHTGLSARIGSFWDLSEKECIPGTFDDTLFYEIKPNNKLKTGISYPPDPPITLR